LKGDESLIIALIALQFIDLPLITPPLTLTRTTSNWIHCPPFNVNIF